MSKQRHKLKINKAFLEAHGIQHESKDAMLDKALNNARKDGKLCVVGILESSEDVSRCFNLRSDLLKKNDGVCDYSNSSIESFKVWESHCERSLTSVDFSDNDLSVLDCLNVDDDRLENFQSLQTLRAKRCVLNSFNTLALSSLKFLKVLDLSGNKLTGFNISSLPPSLVDIDLSSNSIQELSISQEEITFPNLQKINLSENKIKSLPCIHAPSLRDLVFASNVIETFPSTFLSSTTSLVDGSSNLLSDIPNLSKFSNLSVLELSNNKLKRVPCVGKEIKQIGLSNNLLFSLSYLFPSSLLNDPSFRAEVVDIRIQSNAFTTLDDECVLRTLTKMRSLDIAGNDLNVLPSVLGYLPHLQKLKLDGNPLRTMRSALTMDIVDLKKALRMRGVRPNGEDYLENESCSMSSTESNNLQKSEEKEIFFKKALLASNGYNTIKLNSMNLLNLPSSFIDCIISKDLANTVRKLFARQNLLESLDDIAISSFSHLSEIDIGVNKLEKLPLSLRNLAVETLIVDRNRLVSSSLSFAQSGLSNSARNMYKLESSLIFCDLSSNSLEAIPFSKGFPVLRTLLLSFNRISGLSNWTTESFPSLETLDVSNNCIADLGNFPQVCLISSKRLTTLKLQNNDIRLIPPELGNLVSLRCIDLRGNPQRLIRTNVLDKSCDDILAFLRKRIVKTEAGPDREESIRPTLVGFASAQTKDAEVECTNSTNEDKSNLVVELEEKINVLSFELNDSRDLSQAKQYALKKNLSVLKSKLIREKRRLRTNEA